jgi:murein DD-endopeptidase
MRIFRNDLRLALQGSTLCQIESQGVIISPSTVRGGAAGAAMRGLMYGYFLCCIRRPGNSCGGFSRSPLKSLATAVIAACFLGCLPPVAIAANPEPTAFAGAWVGALGAGASQLRLVLTITHLTSGEYTAALNSVDQGAVLPVEALTSKDGTVSFEVRSVGGLYQGKLDDSGTGITGIWKQTGVAPQELTFKRTSTQATAASATASGPTEKPFTIPLDTLVPIAPTAFAADGKFHLVYELHVTNMGSWSCALLGLEVAGEGVGSHLLASFSQANLEGMILQLGTKSAEKSRLAPGASAVVYVWITVARREDLPAVLRQRLSVKLGDYPEVLDLQTYPVPVRTDPIVIGSPLKGDHWVAANGPSNTSGHRRALIPVQGRAMISQRFAIDWVRIYDDGKTYHGDPLDNKNYYAFGAEAFAVADGVVTETLDGVPLNVPGEHSRAVPITLENIGGNHIVLDIGAGHYAFYAHLQPGSLRVKLGDRVRRGQVLGLVGNTGNSTEPHLHFHISNATAPLGAEGLPYAFKSFELQGQASGINAAVDLKEKSATQTLALPSEGEVIKFVVTR